MRIMEEALPASDYSATVATVMQSDENYNKILNALKNIGEWNEGFESLHIGIGKIKLSTVDE